MGEGVDQGPAEEVGELLEEVGLAEPVMVREHGRWRRARRISTLGIATVTGIAVLTGIGMWAQRKPLAQQWLAEEMASRGVRATYEIEEIGFRTQRITNLVVGDPTNPDLTASNAIIQTRIRWTGAVEVYRIAADHVRVKGRWVGDKVSFGEIDKLLPAPSGKPFTLPNIAVDLHDARLSLATPYGPMGLALDGRGNLAGGFRGQLGLASPGLAGGGCRLGGAKGLMTVGVEARRPTVAGPLWADTLTCTANGLALRQPRVEIDAGFTGAANDIGGKLAFAAQEVRAAGVRAGATRFQGQYRINATTREGAMDGRFDGWGIALPPPMTAGIATSLAGLKDTPVGPIAAAWSRAIATAGRDFRVNGALALTNKAGGGSVRIGEASLVAASGATARLSDGEGIAYHWPGGRLRVDGTVLTSDGGLPRATVALAQAAPGATVSGMGSIAPYALGRDSLALPSFRFAAGPDGATRVTAQAIMSGPFPGGRVSGLRVPIAGTVGAGGGFRLGEGCIDTSFAAMTAGSLRLGPTRLPLCATNGAILRKGPGGPMQIGLMNRNTRLRGTIGKSPFALDAASTRFEMGPGFVLDTVRARLGKTDAPVLINAARIDGRLAGAGAHGRFSAGDALIGKVPLKLSEMRGDWRFHKGDITLDGGAMLTDTEDPSRFYPLKSDNVHFTMVDNVIRATGGLHHPDSGTHIADVDISHRLSTGDGHADLSVPGIPFGEELQPEELTRLTQGVIALVQGRLSGQGRIDWTGDGNVTSSGDFTTDNMDLAASFGPVSGMKGTIHFSDLIGLQTDPHQLLTLKSVNAGIIVDDGVIHYQLLPDHLVKIERGEWPFMGGKLILRETILNFGRPSPKRLTFEVVGLNAETFVNSMGFKEIHATGTFDGVLPMIFDEEGGRIVGGRLDSHEGGGTLSYNGVVNRANLGMMGGMAFDALRDLRYQSMVIRLDGYLDGEFATRLTVDGVGLANSKEVRLLRSVNKIPFRFNVSIKGPFRALIATAKSFRDPTDAIAPALPRPLGDVPGISIETRSLPEQLDQSQTPVGQNVTLSTDPNKKP